MHIYIIRHGETYGNLNGDGFSETDLTPKGAEQARLLGERFKDKKLDKIYTSPLVRAVKTAKEIKKHHENTPVIIDSALLEKGTDPDYCGLPRNELINHLPDALIDTTKSLGEETDIIAYERARKIIERIKAENDFDSRIAVVAHGTFNSFFGSCGSGLPPKRKL